MATRQTKILETVVKYGQVEVSTLAEVLDVSKVTIRKDLDELEGRGLVRRERGLAVLVSPDDPAGRIAYHYADKLRIARAAATTIADGEVVMIEAGSCCALLAEEIARTKRGATIVTNSAFIAERVSKAPFAHTVLLGGDYQSDSQVLVGPMVQLCATQFAVDKLFIGTDGFTPRLGFTGRDYLRAAAVHALAARAEQVVILTESEKFGSHGPVPLLEATRVSTVWTDAAIASGHRSDLQAAGVTVNTVDTQGSVVRHSGSTHMSTPAALRHSDSQE
ncbi:DeoR/GlpR family DNA-binding transcription regulator [Cellulomonas sp.]|uniref:DeoR/GlpR family DNA-binding transcription regulator n=1 Tax=Cellulomonas sp. TaxID=40001 RepID=UPI003BAD3FBB